MKAGNLSTYVGTTFILFLFWLLITWSLHYQQLIAGLLCSVLVVIFCKDILIYQEERFIIKPVTFIKLFKYLIGLLVEIFKANIQVAMIVLNPKMPISPTLIEFKTNLKDDLSRVILANSITLTPGTLTVDLEGDVYLVHGLTRANAIDVVDWHMAIKLLDIEEGK
ncbi:Na+/H+ antiporter subunit E [Candidatus Contubernalis alkaliaceticus]|uniref:Na+/H+ antiporter subunit E n=1 Tax=Candidatus Contubernalis alkaliaceticus TaxID=338645 RepID=UPI001F4C265D|nr:Na+/H+ antiporter subunit E [Candidatus Contubernalis alkalaceticus]UNC90907.1 Na+/H+ antiporter subunit E [Candidatus Contubernalis alkalaceticus]